MLSGVISLTAIPSSSAASKAWIKARSLPSSQVMLSCLCNRYYEPLRLPARAVCDFAHPYTHTLVHLLDHPHGSPVLHCSSSVACRLCYPERSIKSRSLYLLDASAFPF